MPPPAALDAVSGATVLARIAPLLRRKYESVVGLSQVFRGMDRDSSGGLDIGELHSALDRMGLAVSRDEVRHLTRLCLPCARCVLTRPAAHAPLLPAVCRAPQAP